MVRIGITVAFLGALVVPAAARADEEPNWRLAPRLQVAAGFDSNYTYRATDPADAGLATAEAGLRLDWLPTLRTRIGARAAYAQEGFVPLVKGAQLDRGGGFDAALEWAYVTSLRTSVDAATGVFTFDAPEAWGGRRSRGGYASFGAQWTPGRALLRVRGSGWLASDAVTAAAQRDDNLFTAGVEMRFTPWEWLGVGMWIDGQRGTSTSQEFRFTGGAAGAMLEVGLWSGATLSGWGGLRRRDYSTARLDTRVTGGASLAQRLGAANRVALQGEWARNESAVFAYERQTAKLVWECEPAWLF